MDIRKIRKLIELIDETGVAEIEIREGEESVRISRYGSPHSFTTMPIPSAPPTNPAILSPAPISNPKPDESASTGHTIKSPMVGTLYVASSPQDAPFVNVGTHVQKGDILCIVEAMKMMNHIEADRAGIIKARLVENGQPVEYNQPLFIMEE